MEMRRIRKMFFEQTTRDWFQSAKIRLRKLSIRSMEILWNKIEELRQDAKRPQGNSVFVNKIDGRSNTVFFPYPSDLYKQQAAISFKINLCIFAGHKTLLLLSGRPSWNSYSYHRWWRSDYWLVLLEKIDSKVL